MLLWQAVGGTCIRKAVNALNSATSTAFSGSSGWTLSSCMTCPNPASKLYKQKIHFEAFCLVARKLLQGFLFKDCW